MQESEETQLDSTDNTSETSSTNESMTKQSLAELRRRLHALNKLIVKTAMASIEQSTYVQGPERRKFKRRLMKDQKKHTDQLMKGLSISERCLLLDELRSMDESKTSQSDSQLPAETSEE